MIFKVDSIIRIINLNLIYCVIMLVVITKEYYGKNI